VRLVACPSCRTQYDVTDRAEPRFACSCGATVENRLPAAVDAEVRRCAACGGLLARGASRCEWCRAEIERDPLRLGLICPECYARNGEAARYCAACGLAFRPQPLPEPEPTLACVDCGTDLVVRAVGDVRVHECGRCGGVWAPGERLDRLVDRAIEARARTVADGEPPRPRRDGGNPLEEAVRYRRCPTCRQYMARRNYRRISGVILDRCPEHGTWLDADELERIAGFVLAGGLERARRAEQREAERGGHGDDPASPALARVLMQRARPGGFLASLVRLVEGRTD